MSSLIELALLVAQVMYAATFIGFGTLWMCSAFAPSSYALDVFTVEVLYCCLDVLAKVITVCLVSTCLLGDIHAYLAIGMDFACRWPLTRKISVQIGGPGSD